MAELGSVTVNITASAIKATEAFEEFLEQLWDVKAAHSVLQAEIDFDGSRSAFIADGGDPDEIRFYEQVFGVGPLE